MIWHPRVIWNDNTGYVSRGMSDGIYIAPHQTCATRDLGRDALPNKSITDRSPPPSIYKREGEVLLGVNGEQKQGRETPEGGQATEVTQETGNNKRETI